MNEERKSETGEGKASRVVEYTLPAYWASYLINGDDSGLGGEDQYYCDKFLAENNLPMPVDCSDEAWLSRYNDSDNGLAGDVLTYQFLI